MSSAATISKVHGQVFAIRDGQEIQLSIGTELLVSDAVRTGLESGCELNFADGTQVQLGSLTQVRIEDFAYDPAGSVEPSFAMHMMEGLVNTVTGEVVKLNPEGFSLSTPLGTAGIRGTTVLTRIFPTHVVFMVTDMAEGHSVHINNIFGNSLTIFQPGQGVELSLDRHNELKSFDFLPQDLKDLILNFMDEDNSGSESHPFFLYGDADFLAAVGATALEGGVGMLSEQAEEIIIALLDELGVEQPEFFLEGPPEGPKYPMAGSFFSLSGDPDPNLLVPGQDSYGPYFKDMNYGITGDAGNDTIVVYNGQDTVYGGQGSFDQIFKITDNMTDGVMLHGGEASLPDVATLDNDIIVIRALGASTDDEAGWTSTNTADYGATTMSGGAVYGSAQTLENSSGGANKISVYGTMDGGAIYGNADTATGSSLGNATITVNQGLDENGNLVGGDMTGGVIYGDAETMNNSRAGYDYISVHSMSGGTIYGDAASGTYTAVGNRIYVTEVMSDGTIYAGNGDDYVDIGTMIGGAANMGDGNDQLIIGAYENGAINMGTGNDSLEITRWAANSTLDLDTVNNTLKLVSSDANIASIKVDSLSGTLTLGDSLQNKAVSVDDQTSGTVNLGTGTGNSLTITDMTGGNVYGDAHTLTNSTGGDDNITITKMYNEVVVVEKHVYGDGYTLNSSTGGNDTITITDAMDSGNVYGDARTMSTGCIGGNDTIKISTLNAGEVRGDAYSMSGNALGGDDSITITDMYGGFVIGDANYLNDTSTGGNDTIKVTTMHAGIIYGNSGDDEITITTVKGTKAKTIDADSGSDTVKISNLAKGSEGFGMKMGSDSDVDYLDLRGLKIEGSNGTFFFVVNDFEKTDDKIVYTASDWKTISPQGANGRYTLVDHSDNALNLDIAYASDTAWDLISTQTMPPPVIP
ncbi:FecR domain-containing protein [Desulfovibrio sp. OttesenSCG-928-M16]|nr:FecR domain-containing protein [Desulfovibrio sp. OttesenSCG-928-M16]